jgi:thioredoxin-like negative regulator of GroEL
LRDKIGEHPEQKMLLAELLIESRSTEEASSVVEDLVQQARTRLEADPTQLSIRVELADALRTLKRYREASGLFLELKDEKLLAAVRNSSAALTAAGWHTWRNLTGFADCRFQSPTWSCPVIR